MKTFFNKDLINNPKIINNKNKGVTLISLVITIIVIIIIVAIVYYSVTQTISKASLARFANELQQIEEKAQSIRSSNEIYGRKSFEEEENAGFTKVYLNNAPKEFISFNDDDTTGYLIDMDFIKAPSDLKWGRGKLPCVTATFGVDDVVVYDKEGKAFYLKGYLETDGSLLYRIESIAESTVLMDVPLILNVSYDMGVEDKFAVARVQAEPVYGGDLTVKVGNTLAYNSNGNMYSAELYKNDTYYVIVKEENGYYNSAKLKIQGIDMNVFYEPPIIDYVDFYDYNTGYGYISIEAHDYNYKIDAACFKINDDSKPDESEWFYYQPDIEFYNGFSVYESGTYFVWVRNTMGAMTCVDLDINLEVKYYINYYSSYGGTMPSQQIKYHDEDIMLSSITPTSGSYHFLGWTTQYYSMTNADRTEIEYHPGDIYTQNRGLTLYAIWVSDKFYITLNGNGGNNVSSVYKTYDVDIALPDTIPTRSGFRFLGWARSSSAAVPDYYPGDLVSFNKPTTLYAVWEELTYTISFDVNGGVGTFEPVTKRGGQSLVLPTNGPTKEGCEFIGWAKTMAAVVPDYMPGGLYTENANKTLYAVFDRPGYSITFDANGGSGSKTVRKYHDVAITIPKNSGFYYDYNHELLGWSTNSSATEPQYVADDVYTGNGNATLYAVWEYVESYTIRYSTDGGASTGYTSYGLKANSLFYIKTDVPKKTGYVFKGWSYSGGSELYSPGELFTGFNEHPQNYVLIAVWETSQGIAMLKDGKTFNSNLKKLAYSYAYNYTTQDTKIKSVQWANVMSSTEQEKAVIVSDSSSIVPVYAWFDTDTIYLYTTAYKVELNQDSSYMFYYFTKVTNIDLSKFNSNYVSNISYMFYDCAMLVEINGLSAFNNSSRLRSMAGTFEYCSKLTNIDISQFNTHGVTTMYDMFYGCTQLTKIVSDSSLATEPTILDVSGLDTSSVEDMRYMFSNCSNITSADLSALDTGKVTTMQRMFSGATSMQEVILPTNTSSLTDIQGMFTNCYVLASVDFSNFDTSKVTTMNGLFSSCRQLQDFDLEHLKTQNVTDMGSMFYGCYLLTDADVSTILSGLNTYKVTSMSSMFSYCSGLVAPDISMLNAPALTSMSYMFSNTKITSLNLEGLTLGSVQSMNGLFSGNTVIQSVIFQDLDTINLRNMSAMFKGCTNLTSVDISGLNTEKLGNISEMFSGCTSLADIDLSDWDTEKVTDMSKLFYGCTSLTNVSLSGWYLRNVTTMANLFNGCTALENVDLSNVSAINLTSMQYMFGGCTKLANVNLSSFSAPNVTDISYLFYGCTSLTSVNLENFDMTKVTTLYYMFNGCTGLTEIDISSLNIPSATTIEGMFYGCTNLASVNMANLNLPSVTTVANLFYNCKALENVNLSNVTANNLTNMQYMFGGCSKLVNLNLSTFNAPNLTNMSYMFYNCTKLANLNMEGFYTGNVTTMYYLFANCKSLVEVDLSQFNTQNVTTMYGMFYYCSSLASVDFGELNMQNVLTTYYMFYYCTSLASIDLSNMNAPNLTNMTYMFAYCNGLTSANISNINIPKLTTVQYMFYQCTNLSSVDLSNITSSTALTSMYEMFGYCSKLTEIDLSSMYTGKVSSIGYMFYQCSKLQKIYVASDFSFASGVSGSSVFYNCSALVGGAGTTYNSSRTSYVYARVDGGTSTPGYFTVKP